MLLVVEVMIACSGGGVLISNAPIIWAIACCPSAVFSIKHSHGFYVLSS